MFVQMCAQLEQTRAYQHSHWGGGFFPGLFAATLAGVRTGGFFDEVEWLEDC